MLLLDIGNSNIKIFKEGKIISKMAKAENFPKFERFYYICVNKNLKDIIPENGIDISSWFEFKSSYQNLGIDRIAACYTIQEGVVVDAGSAITIDIMQNHTHQGGIILPGLNSYKKCYATISPVLDKELNKNISLEKLPQNTTDAMSFGVFASLKMIIENLAKNKSVYLSGGDGEILKSFIKNSIFKKDLVFNGMIKAIKEKDVNGCIA